ncbi:GCN5-related N-acetyltransferase [Desulforamulus reducens MI-1]|uniref:GCN5-related N-acetyltransferase n=1 Tax=Desulforamulus reducens (strain ATCC BAA-1160 / DSM 100696 / MI-1) TaxID=349161 RepID=A4J224_DESRM|nr:GNAT family N-acetyltransferase [Desulforamulus reducens]ABO49127.1 GCN5-related N-acetyltransferase [Desulforamulus reducens MI-1]
MKIREAHINDAPAISKVTVDTWKTAYRGIISDEYLNNLSYEEREKGWREFPFHNSFIYVAENETQNIIGFAAAGPERTSNPVYSGELYAIYIYKDQQNKGIGSSLIRSVMKRFEQLGIYSVLVWVLSESPYRRFYERNGGYKIDSKLLEMDGFKSEVTAYGWLDIRAKF